MLLNGNPFQIYLIETIDDIIKRIAVELKTIPKWLLFPDGRPTDKDDIADKDIKAENFLLKILNQTSVSAIEGPYPDEANKEDIYRLYIASHNLLSDDTARRSYLFAIEAATKTPELNFEDYWKNREIILKNLDIAIQTARKEVASIKTRNEFIESIPAVKSTPFEVTHVRFNVDMGHYDGTLHDLFDSVTLDSTVPYATCSISGNTDMYKIYQQFKVDPSWLDLKFKNSILLKVNTTYKDHPFTSHGYSFFTNAIFEISEQKKLLGTFDTIVSSENRIPYLNKEKFTNRALQVFTGLKNKIEQSRDVTITSRFTIPRQCFDASMFTDMVMNNENVSSFVVIDEFVNVSRVSNKSCYVKLLSKLTSAVNLSLIDQSNGHQVAKHGRDSYIMCRTQTSTTEDIVPLQELILKIFTIYNREVQKIAAFYTKYLPGFVLNECTTTATSQQLTKRPKKGRQGIAQIEPEIFVEQYSRRCSQRPVIIENEEDAVDIDGSKLQILKFPTRGELASDGTPFKTRLYVCKAKKNDESNEYKYPGFRKNDLSNQKLFPQIPCCYKTNKINTKLYNEYYFNDKQPQQQDNTEDEELCDRAPLIVRDNPLPQPDHDIELPEETNLDDKPGPAFGKFDLLPESLVNFFNIMDTFPLRTYIRRGVTRHRYSSIEAIMLGSLRINAGQKKKPRANVLQKFITQLRNDIERYANSAKQELYDQSIEEIKESIITSQYLIPSKYIHLIETLLDINIFVFKDNGLFVPRHSKMYVKYTPSKQTFMLYEHSGNIVELIGYKETDKSDNTFQGYFAPNDEVITNISKFFRSLSLSYYKQIDTKQFEPIPTMRQLTSEFNITGQILDYHGKCRAFVIDRRFTLIPDIPIPPYAALIVRTLPRVSLRDLKADAMFKNLKILWKRCIRTSCREIGVVLQKKPFTILVDDEQHHHNIATHPQTPMYEEMENDSVILKYQLEKKQSYVVLKNTITELLNSITNIAKIDDDLHRYAMANGGMTPENIRLLYACKQWIKTHTQDSISSLSVNVLKSIPMTYTLYGIDAVRNLIKTYDYDYDTLFDSPRLTWNTKPYFFKCNDIIYLAVPAAGGLDAANRIIYSWVTTQSLYNDVQQHEKYTYKVFVFNSPNRLIEITTETDGSDNEGGIVLYIHDEERYDALLEL